ncbi:MAG: ATP-binding protein [Gemmatimonadales bacterium]|nr:ATP-binding protein [Gemmatimonadales bacterium]MYC89520.1 ATP-binding protein [Candidatus Palauibacter denitrificans]
MMSKSTYLRPYAQELLERLREPRRFIQVITGARQVGKTTLITQVAERAGGPYRFATADEPSLRGRGWIAQQWAAARLMADESDSHGALLIIDEVQKAAGWAEAVKRLWDEDTRTARPLKVVLSGSAPLLVERGLTESLAGRFERLHLPHWSFSEMQAAFGWSLEQYLFYGGYPGAAPLVRRPERWARYIRDSLIETTIARDVLLLSRVDKPALLRRLFALGCAYSGQILSYTKMLGQLHDAGNTTTLAHYLDLLAGAGMLTGLQKYSGAEVRRRGSSPKLHVFNTALMTAGSRLTLSRMRANPESWGRLVESAVGAHLANAADMDACEVYYWRDRGREVDFVLRAGSVLTALEVKSGRASGARSGLAAFADRYRPTRSLVVGGDGIPIDEFLSRPVEHWLRP